MTTIQRVDVSGQIASITATLAARRDPAYEAGMRRTVPSAQPAHSSRVPDVHRVASEWRREHRRVAPDEAKDHLDG